MRTRKKTKKRSKNIKFIFALACGVVAFILVRVSLISSPEISAPSGVNANRQRIEPPHTKSPPSISEVSHSMTNSSGDAVPVSTKIVYDEESAQEGRSYITDIGVIVPTQPYTSSDGVMLNTNQSYEVVKVLERGYKIVVSGTNGTANTFISKRACVFTSADVLQTRQAAERSKAKAEADQRREMTISAESIRQLNAKYQRMSDVKNQEAAIDARRNAYREMTRLQEDMSLSDQKIQSIMHDKYGISGNELPALMKDGIDGDWEWDGYSRQATEDEEYKSQFRDQYPASVLSEFKFSGNPQRDRERLDYLRSLQMSAKPTP